MKISMKNILVPVDLSGHNKDAIAYAASVAEWQDGTLHLVHVLENYVGFDLFYDQKTRDEFMREMQHKAEEKLAEAYPELKERKLKHKEIVLRGDAVEEICKYAKTNAMDLIILEPHGASAGFLQKALFGSNHERIIQNAGCPVLTVVPKKKF